MVQIRQFLCLAKFGSGDGLTQKAVFTPKGLYKHLMRQCNKLPREEISDYYKHHIRQGYQQHADESDPQRVVQIVNQAVKDIEWILKKYTSEK